MRNCSVCRNPVDPRISGPGRFNQPSNQMEFIFCSLDCEQLYFRSNQHFEPAFTCMDEPLPVLEFNKIKEGEFVLKERIPPDQIADIHTRVEFEKFVKQWTFEARKKMISEQVKVENSVVVPDIPKTWIDHLKHQYRDNWIVKQIVKRWPIQYKNKVVTVSLERNFVFPKAYTSTHPQFKEYIIIDGTKAIQII